MALINKIRTGANGFSLRVSASAFTGNGTNSKTLLALPSSIPKQSGHKLGSDEMNIGGVLALIGASVSGLVGCATVAYCDEADQRSVCPYYPWPNRDVLSTSDPTLISSGKRAFQNSCAACHSNLSLAVKPSSDTVVKAVVTQIDVANDPKYKARMFTNTATPKDQISYPYANKYRSRFANGGANLPDISKFLEVMRNNPCYSGRAISMHNLLSSCAVEYTTLASASQVARDLVKS